mmetsp:Transcript_28317/g.42820  ORF Transcript_28317/g.42820 Transcript_28317/m.42820 type:complete len:787 (-) Transcript_28317:37-2397(-)
MGKNKKKDPAKKAALQAKKDAKAVKAARKRMKKQSEATLGGNNNDDGLDDENASTLEELLDLYQQKDIQGTKPSIETLDGFPPPRGNFTMTVVDQGKKKGSDIYIFGGEYFDGISSIVVNHLLKYRVSSNDWQQIITPQQQSPPPRCAHSTVYYNGALYVFGGELSSTDYYQHYKDLWKYSIADQSWTELKSSGGPSSRSGHGAMAWKSYMIVFGGFYEGNSTTEAPRWFNDVHIYNLKAECWLSDISYSKLGQKPEPRSACNVSLVEGDRDAIMVHGGFSKLLQNNKNGEQKKESKVHTDVWLLHLKPILQNKAPTWEKIASSSSAASFENNNSHQNPNGRSACASCTYNNKNQNMMIVFGGVLDAELLHHKVDSIFFNDLHGLQIKANTTKDKETKSNAAKPKWFPIRIKKSSMNSEYVISLKEKEDDDNNSDEDDYFAEQQDDNTNSTIKNEPSNKGWDIHQLRENMFAFVDGKGNVVYERMDKETKQKLNSSKVKVSDSDNESDEEKEEEKEEADSSDEEEEETKQEDNDDSNAKISSSSASMRIDPQTKAPEIIQRTEPLPRIKCGTAIVHRHLLLVYGGLVEIGDREVTLDDMWCLDLKKKEWDCIYPGTMHQQIWRGAEEHDDDDSYISSTAGDDGEEEEDLMDSVATKTKTDGDDRDPELVEELLQLISKHDLGNENTTPQPEEVLADYYARTCNYWNEYAAAANGDEEPLDPKELKREGFQLAKTQFEELEPILERFQELRIRTSGSSSSNNKKDAKKKDKKKKDKKEKKKKSKKDS